MLARVTEKIGKYRLLVAVGILLLGTQGVRASGTWYEGWECMRGEEIEAPTISGELGFILGIGVAMYKGVFSRKVRTSICDRVTIFGYLLSSMVGSWCLQAWAQWYAHKKNQYLPISTLFQALYLGSFIGVVVWAVFCHKVWGILGNRTLLAWVLSPITASKGVTVGSSKVEEAPAKQAVFGQSGGDAPPIRSSKAEVSSLSQSLPVRVVVSLPSHSNQISLLAWLAILVALVIAMIIGFYVRNK